MAETSNVAETIETPKTRFGQALTGFASRLDELSSKETSLVHGQLWFAIGTEALIGAATVAMVGSGHNPEVSSMDMVRNILGGSMPTDGSIHHGSNVMDDPQYWSIWKDGNWSGETGWGFPDMKLKDFAEHLIRGGFTNQYGKPVYLLNGEQTSNISSALEDLTKLESKRDLIRNVLALSGIGFLASNVKRKSMERVSISTSVLPGIALGIKKIGEML